MQTQFRFSRFVSLCVGRILPIAIVASLVAACAHRAEVVAPQPSLWNDKAAVIGVALAPSLVASTYKAGAQGLLDIAINSAVASSLTDHLEKFDARCFQQAQFTMIEKLRARGLNVKAVSTLIDPKKYPEVEKASAKARIASHNYTALMHSEGIDRLLLLQLDQIGTSRSYYAFVPTGAPVAIAKASGQMIDLKTGTLLWGSSSLRNQAIATPWDEPPGYPHIDAAIVEAITAAGNAIISDLVY